MTKLEYNRSYYLKNREKLLAQQREYNSSTRSKRAEYKKRNAAKIAPQRRLHLLKAKWKMTEDEFNEILAQQDGGCAICTNNSSDRSLAVDHCHATQKIRGLLCSRCNLGLGQFNDNTTLLLKAVDYINTHNLESRV